MVAYQFATPAGERLPEYAVRRKIEQQVAKAAHEHLIIFTDAGQTRKSGNGSSASRASPPPVANTPSINHHPATRSCRNSKPSSSRDEEETLVLTDVTRRARAGFDVERVTKKFYEQFRKEHGAFLGFIKGITEVADHTLVALADRTVGVSAPITLSALGNLALLALPKTALFCSARCPGKVILTAYDQAAKWRDAGRCVISGGHSRVRTGVNRGVNRFHPCHMPDFSLLLSPQ